MKKICTLVVFLIFVLGTTESSDALTYQFNGTISSSPFQALMELNVSNKKLTIKLQNTTPEYLNFTIAGFGVSVLNYPSITSGKKWTLLEAGGKDVTDRWYLNSVANYQLSFFGISSALDGLYNPKYTGIKKDYFTTTALFTADFTSGTPELNPDVAPIIYVGNTGSANYSTFPGMSASTPEPGTIIMLGLGLIGIGVFLMLRKKK